MPSMSGYTKLFNSILASTIWEADMPTRIVWITLLAMANKNGVAEGSIPGLATFARVPLEDCRRAIDALQSPDPDSRTKDHDGRRIEAVDGGWRLINHAKYRAKLGADERRAYLRQKQAEYREKQRSGKPKRSTRRKQKVLTVSDTSTPSTHTEAEADTEADPFYVLSPQEPGTAGRAARTGKGKQSEVTIFIERFVELYAIHRFGAKYFVQWERFGPIVRRLLNTYGAERLEKLAMVLMKTDEEWIEGTDRGIGILSTKASWLEERLATYEAQHGPIRVNS